MTGHSKMSTRDSRAVLLDREGHADLLSYCLTMRRDHDSKPDFLDAPSSFSVRVEPPSTTLLDRVLEKLRGAILDFHFPPGHRLVERELCEQLGVSRSSVREALRRLEAEGLIRTVPHKGRTVASVTASEAASLYEVRAELEGFTAELFAERATDEQVRRLRSRLRDMKAAMQTNDPRVLLAAKAAFYDVILEGCGNEYCADLIRSMQARIRFLRALSMTAPGRTQRSLAEMTRIVKAVENRDGDAARAAYTEHISIAAAVAIQALSDRMSKKARTSRGASAAKTVGRSAARNHP
jgi:DNA-binding GntR family transcriptional regulator